MPHVGPHSGEAHGLGHNNPRPKSLVTSTTLIWKNFGGRGRGRGRGDQLPTSLAVFKPHSCSIYPFVKKLR